MNNRRGRITEKFSEISKPKSHVENEKNDSENLEEPFILEKGEIVTILEEIESEEQEKFYKVKKKSFKDTKFVQEKALLGTVPSQIVEIIDEKKENEELNKFYGKQEYLVDVDHTIYYYDSIMKDKYNVYRTIIDNRRYRCRHFNGFMQVLLEPYGEAYFICQAQNEYLLPDWKLHVSVKKDEEEYKKVWNCLIDIFFKYKLLAMKMQVQGDKWKTDGRSFTIYMYTDHPKYEAMDIEYQWQRNSEVLKTKFANLQYSSKVWLKVIDEIEEKLEKMKITTMGCEKGDLAIGKYVSIRNESFCRRWKQSNFKENGKFPKELKLVYPPNNCGWNSRGHKYFPLLDSKISTMDFDYLMPEKNDDESFLFCRVLIPQNQYDCFQFDKIYEDLKHYPSKLKTKEFIKTIINSYTLCAILCRNITNQIKSVDFMFQIFENKNEWGKFKGSREYIIEKLGFIVTYSLNEQVQSYTKQKLKNLEVYYLEKKHSSQGKRIIKKFQSQE